MTPSDPPEAGSIDPTVTNIPSVEPSLPAPLVRALVDRALQEDLGAGDVTTDLVTPVDAEASGILVARAEGVLAGRDVARAVFRATDRSLTVDLRREDGDRLGPGEAILRVKGSARSILRAERTALNFLQRLSGIATLTARFVDAVRGTEARIVDTRKTTPGLRALEKYAVRCGGGANHRFGLSDGFLLKDNHRAVLRAGGRSLASAVEHARRHLSHTVPVEVEIDDLDRLAEAVEAGVDAVLLDNFSPEDLRAAVDQAGGHVLLEASGGITLETVRQVAETGVDLISVGALTHSAPSLDLALDFEAG